MRVLGIRVVLVMVLMIFVMIQIPRQMKVEFSEETMKEGFIQTYQESWAVIQKVNEAPTIDGMMNEPIWTETAPLENFYTLFNNNLVAVNENDRSSPRIHIAYDSSHLYIGLVHPQHEGLARVEVLLSPRWTVEEYYHIPIGMTSDASSYSTNWGPGRKLPAGVAQQTAMQDGIMYTEISVPLHSIQLENVYSGMELGLNVINLYEENTSPMNAWVPIRTSMTDLSSNDSFIYYANVTDEGRLGSIFFDTISDDSGDSRTPWYPEQLTLAYESFTEKSIHLPELSDQATIGISWKQPTSGWITLEPPSIVKNEVESYILFEHPMPLDNGIYKLKLDIDEPGEADSKTVILTFDREDMILAGLQTFSTALDQRNQRSVEPTPPSGQVKMLLDLIPENTGFHFVGIPEKPELRPDGIFTWNILKPEELSSIHSKLTYPNDRYPEDQVLTVPDGKGGVAEYPYYEDEVGRRYFFTAHLWYKQRLHVMQKTRQLAASDPLGAARLLHRFAEVYERYVPTSDYMWRNLPVDPSSGPPYPRYGGMWIRWSVAELAHFQYLIEAYETINKTTAFQVLSELTGEDVQKKIVDGMLKPSIEYVRTFPSTNHNYENMAGLIAMGRALNEPDYVHEGAEIIKNYATNNYLFDGFNHQLTLSYHNQLSTGLNKAIDTLQGWTDPEGYISPRTGTRMVDMNIRERFPALGKAKDIPEILIYPNGKYLPIHDTWANESSTNPRRNAGSYILPASGLARLARAAHGVDQEAAFLTYLPNYGGHYHYDPLNLTLFARGQELLPDIGYTHTFYNMWTMSTLAHNTVVVDSSNMSTAEEAKHGGNIEVFAPIDPTVQIVRARQESAYPQTNEYNRELWSIKFEEAENGEGYLLDLFRVSGGTRHEYTLQGDANRDAYFESDLLMEDYGPYLLPEGTVVREPVNTTDLGDAQGNYHGYLYVRDVKKTDIGEGFYGLTLVTEERSEKKAQLNIFGIVEPGDNELFIGRSPSLRSTRLQGRQMDTNEEALKYDMPKLVLRREGTDLKSQFITAMEPYTDGETPRIQRIERLTPDQFEDGDLAVAVYYDHTTDIILSSPHANTQEMVVGDIIFQGTMGMIRLINDNVHSMHLIGGTRLSKGHLNVTIDAAPITGTLTGTRRLAEGDDYNALVSNATVPSQFVGQYVVVTHPDGSTHGYRIEQLLEEGQSTLIGLGDMDPGFSITAEDRSAMQFYPFTEWNGTHSFRIENTVREDFALATP